MSDIERVYEFKDPAALTQAVKWLLIGMVVFGAVGVVLVLKDIPTIYYWQSGAIPPETASKMLAESDGGWGDIIETINRVLYMTAFVVILIWIYRANNNAHALRAKGMRFTPGWAIGWYFIPVLNFWKPYQAMREIWKVSANPKDWEDEKVSPLLRWWWFFWVFAAIVLTSIVPLTVWFSRVGEIVLIIVVAVFFVVIQSILCLIFIPVAGRICKMQQENAEISRVLA